MVCMGGGLSDQLYVYNPFKEVRTILTVMLVAYQLKVYCRQCIYDSTPEQHEYEISLMSQ